MTQRSPNPPPFWIPGATQGRPEPMEIPFEARMPGTPLGVRMLRHEMSIIATDCGMDAAGVADVLLAVTEAATNAVMHGYAQATGELTVRSEERRVGKECR